MLRASSTQPLRRHISSRGLATTSSLNQRDLKTKSRLTADRQRDLISLYHQTEHCVTLENLSDIIDLEFTTNYEAIRPQKLDVAQLTGRLNRIHKAPKFAPVGYQISKMREFGFRFGEDTKGRRMEQIRAVLYGMDPKAVRLEQLQTGLKKRVGLEMLQEFMEETKKAHGNLEQGARLGATGPSSTNNTSTEQQPKREASS